MRVLGRSWLSLNVLIADDCALNASTESDTQHNVNQFSRACDNFGLTISTKKTEVLHQPSPGKPYMYIEPNILVNDVKLQAVDKFTSWEALFGRC